MFIIVFIIRDGTLNAHWVEALLKNRCLFILISNRYEYRALSHNSSFNFAYTSLYQKNTYFA